jgi:hypothetical protein
MAPRFPFNPNLPIPNNPFYTLEIPTIQGQYYPIAIGSGLALDSTSGVLSTTGGGGGGSGTVTSIVVGNGLTGGTIVTSGTIALNTACVIQPTAYAAKGTLLTAAGPSSPSALAVGNNGQSLVADSNCTTGLKWVTLTQCQGTVTSITAGTGLTGGAITGSGTVALDTTCVIQPTVFPAKGSLISAIAASTPTALGVGTDGQVLTACAACAVGLTWAAGGGGSVARTTTSVTTASIANGASDNVSITIPATYALLKIQTSHAAWVTLYTDTASRTSDASRTENTDPLPGTGVVAEVITSGATTQLISPGTRGFRSDGTGTSYARIKNKSGATAAITVTLTYVKLEG